MFLVECEAPPADWFNYRTGVKEAVEWLKTRVMWNKESRPPTMR